MAPRSRSQQRAIAPANPQPLEQPDVAQMAVKAYSIDVNSMGTRMLDYISGGGGGSVDKLLNSAEIRHIVSVNNQGLVRESPRAVPAFNSKS